MKMYHVLPGTSPDRRNAPDGSRKGDTSLSSRCKYIHYPQADRRRTNLLITWLDGNYAKALKLEIGAKRRPDRLSR